jgi:hypothetical protein
MRATSEHPPATVQVRGNLLEGRLAFVRKRFGESHIARVLDALEDRAGAARLSTGVEPGLWYPFALFVSLSQAIDRVCGRGDGALYRPMGAAAVDKSLRGASRVLLRIASVGLLLEKAGTSWRQLYTSGRLVIRRSEERLVEVELADFETPHAVHCEAVAGWLERYLAVGGFAGGRVDHTACRAHDDAACLFAVAWAPGAGGVPERRTSE